MPNIPSPEVELLSTSKTGIYSVNLLSKKDSVFGLKPQLDLNLLDSQGCILFVSTVTFNGLGHIVSAYFTRFWEGSNEIVCEK